MVTEAKKRSNAKWDKENMTMLGCKVRKAKADEFKAACKLSGTTPNAVFRKAMDEFLEEFYRGAEGRQEAAEKANEEAGVLGMILGAGEGKTE